VAVDLQEKRQLDLARQVSVVKARTRPWRSIIALVLAVAAAIVSLTARDVATEHVVGQVIAIAAAVAFFGLAVIAVIGFAGKSRDVMQPVTGRAHAAVVRYTIVLVGSIAALFITLALLDVPIDQLLVGGAVTSIILGIAAQQALGNVFSGLVLLFSHPFGVGDAVSFRSGAFGGQIDGIVTEIGISYVRVETAEGTIRLPNSQVLASAVGPADQAEQADQAERAGQAEQAGRAEQAGQAGLAGQISPAEQVGQVEQGGGKGQAGQMPTQAATGKAPRGSPPAG
jgi:mechanosensitive ion channel-like protein